MSQQHFLPKKQLVGPEILTFENLILKGLNETKSKNKTVIHNCSKVEITAIENLSNNNDLTIKSTDNGGGSDIMNITDHEKEVTRQLNDCISYTQK